MLARIFGGMIGREQVLSKKASATNGQASVTFPGQAGTRLEITKVVWSYSIDPLGGSLMMTGPTVAPDIDITKGGPGGLQFGAVVAPDGTDITVTLAAGGGGCEGKLYVEAVRRP